jgi:Txe/YoeB family toxin of toxin-antitoxin system
VVKWRVVYTKLAQKDAKKLSAAGLRKKAETLLDILRENPYQTPPPFEKLLGDLSGAYSRRINIQHRLVYQILDDEKVVKVIHMWTHFE